jgi:hypothetical protein
MILKEIVDLMDIACKNINMDYKRMKICELGDQRMKWTPHGTGKNFLLDKGVNEHVSIDLNGKRGALKIDLSRPIDRWQGYFDMTTNYGTAEHVQDGIYEAFQNIHNFTRVGGAMVHAGPPTGGCPWHSPYHYDPDFFEKLAKASQYKHIMSEVRVTAGRRGVSKDIDRSLVCSVLVKEHNLPFITKEQFMDLKGIEGLK